MQSIVRSNNQPRWQYTTLQSNLLPNHSSFWNLTPIIVSVFGISLLKTIQLFFQPTVFSVALPHQGFALVLA